MTRHPALLTSLALALALSAGLQLLVVGRDSDPASSPSCPSEPEAFATGSCSETQDPSHTLPARTEKAGAESCPTAAPSAAGWAAGLTDRTRVVQVCVVMLCLGLLILIKK